MAIDFDQNRRAQAMLASVAEPASVSPEPQVLMTSAQPAMIPTAGQPTVPGEPGIPPGLEIPVISPVSAGDRYKLPIVGPGAKPATFVNPFSDKPLVESGPVAEPAALPAKSLVVANPFTKKPISQPLLGPAASQATKSPIPASVANVPGKPSTKSATSSGVSTSASQVPNDLPLASGLPTDEGGALFRKTPNPSMDPSVAAAIPANKQTAKWSSNPVVRQKQIGDAMIAQVKDEAQLQAANILANSAAEDEVLAKQDKYNAEATLREDKRQELENQRLARLGEAQAKISAAEQDAKNFEIQDGGFVKRNPGALLAVIGAVFGGALAGRTGQPNTALQSLDAMINRDIQAQKDRYNQKRSSVADAATSYGRLREYFGDERAADLMSEVNIRRNLNDELANMAAKSKNDQFRQTAAIMLQEGRKKELSLLDQLTGREIAKMEAQAAAARQARAVEAQRSFELVKKGIEHKYDMEKLGVETGGKQQASLQQRWVPGAQGFAANPEEAKGLKDAIEVRQLVNIEVPKIIERFKKLGAMGRGLNWNGERSQLVQDLGQLVSAVKNKITQAGGTLTDTEKQLIGINENDVDAIIDARDQVPNKLQNFMRGISEVVDNRINNAGLQKGTQSYRQNPITNQVETYYELSGSTVNAVRPDSFPKAPDSK